MLWRCDAVTSICRTTRVVTSYLTSASSVAMYRLSNTPISCDHIPRWRDWNSARSKTTWTILICSLANMLFNLLMFNIFCPHSMAFKEMNKVVSVRDLMLDSSLDTRALPHRPRTATPWRLCLADRIVSSSGSISVDDSPMTVTHWGVTSPER